MDADLRKHLVDMQNHASAMSKVESGQKRLNWYYLALTIDAQLKGAAPIPPPPPAKPTTVTGKAAAPMPLIVTIPTPTPGVPTFPPAGSVQVATTDSLSAKVAANPVGTVFAIMPGVHSGANATCTPKNNQQFIGAPGTLSTLTSIMDGGSSTQHAFIGGASTGVVVRNLEVRNYATPGQRCAIRLDRDFDTCDGWLVDNVYVHNNTFGGVSLGNNCTLSNSRVSTNGSVALGGIGCKGSGSTNAHLDNVEIDANNPGLTDPYVECGGSKFANTTGLIVENCNVHHNRIGPGLWTDINNFQVTYRNNTVAYNDYVGIFHEISYDAVIHDNIVTGNGVTNNGWIWNAGILISASGGVGTGIIDVYNNTLDGNRCGVSLIQQNRGSGNRGPCLVRNVKVHNNTIYNTIHETGMAQDIGSNAIYTTGGNLFDFNTYHAIGDGFALNDGDFRSFAYWQANGQDVHGSVV